VTLFGGGYSIGSERWTGTLEEIFSCPTPIYVIALGKITAMMTLGIVSFLVSIGLALVYLHSLFATFDPIPFAISALVTMIGFLSIALVLAPIFCVTRNALWYANAAEFPVDLFAGFMFPIRLLVGWTHPLSYAIPVTWSVNGLNAAAGSGAGITQYLFWWAMGLLVSCVYFAAAVPAFAWADRTARVNGELQAI
jgi:ABC-type multidrug transport system permease subunit